MDIDYMLDDDKCCTLRNEFIDKNNPDAYDAWDAGWRAACEAMASRQTPLSPPQPVAGLKWGCVVEEAKHGLWNVHTANRSHFLGVCGDIWVSYVGRPEYDRDYGTFADKAVAIAALAACPTPPPGVQA